MVGDEGEKWANLTSSQPAGFESLKKIFTDSEDFDILKKWWVMRDSNLRPPACKAGALTNWANHPNGANYMQKR